MMDLIISTEVGGGSSLSWCNTLHYVVSKRLWAPEVGVQCIMLKKYRTARSYQWKWTWNFYMRFPSEMTSFRDSGHVHINLKTIHFPGAFSFSGRSFSKYSGSGVGLETCAQPFLGFPRVCPWLWAGYESICGASTWCDCVLHGVTARKRQSWHVITSLLSGSAWGL